MGAGVVPVCQWAAKGIVDQKPCWSSEIAALSPSARDHLGLKPKQELPPGSSRPLWHRSAGAGGSGAEPQCCGRSHDCPPSVWQSPSQASVAGDFCFKQSQFSLSPFPPDLPPSQGVCPRGTASSELRHVGCRMPAGCPQPRCVPWDPPGRSGTGLAQASVVIWAGSFISKPCSPRPPQDSGSAAAFRLCFLILDTFLAAVGSGWRETRGMCRHHRPALSARSS